MDTPLITQIFRDLNKDFSNSINLLTPVAIQLLMWFFMYELLTGLLLAKAGTNPLLVLKDKIKTWAFLYAIIYFFKNMMGLINSIFQYFVKVSTGETPNKLEELPYQLLTTAYTSLNGLLDNVSWRKPSTWVLLIGCIIGLFIFARICLTVGMVILEYMIMSSLVIVLLPFMMFEKLRFVGDKVVGTLINLNMKLFVIQYLMFYFSKFLKEDLVTQGNTNSLIESSFYWLAAMGMLALVTLKGSEMAQTLVSGVTSFGDSSELVGMARAGIGRAAAGIKGSILGAKIGTGAIGGMVKGAKAGAMAGSITGGNMGLRSIGEQVGAFLGGAGGAIKGGYDTYKKEKDSRRK